MSAYILMVTIIGNDLIAIIQKRIKDHYILSGVNLLHSSLVQISMRLLLIFLKRKEMMKVKLVLAERSSVAQSIAKVSGATNREDGYLEDNGHVVSSCVGHLVELSEPESYDEKYKKWNYDDLSIIPTNWNYQVSLGIKNQLGILKKLVKRSDITTLVCATDTGREG